MNFVCAIIILGRFTTIESNRKHLQLTDEPLENTLSEIVIDPDSDACRRAEYDVYCFMLQLAEKSGKLGLHSLWQGGQCQIKVRAFQLDRLVHLKFIISCVSECMLVDC